MAKKNLKKYKGGGINWKELGYGVTNTGKAVADVGLSALGADDAISDQDYKGNSGTAFSKVSGTAGSVTKALVPTALAIGGGALAVSMGQNPMMGAQIGMGVGKGIQSIGGAANPQNDPRGERSEIQGNMATNERLESSIYGLGDTSMALGKSIAPMIAQAESAGSARYGGIKKKCEDGGTISNAPIDSLRYQEETPYGIDNMSRKERRLVKKFGLDPNTLSIADANKLKKTIDTTPTTNWMGRTDIEGTNAYTNMWGGTGYKDKGMMGGSSIKLPMPTAMFPYGGTVQVDGPSHEEGGVDINSPNGSYEVEKEEVIKTEPGQDKILSDKLKFKPTGKTYAKEYKKYQTLVDLVNNPKKTVGIPDTFKKDIIAKADIKFNELFNAQEIDKQKRVNSYIKRLGGLQTFGDGGPNKKVIDRNAYTSDFTRFEKQGAGNNDIAGDMVDSNFQNLGFKKATDVSDQYPVWISPEGQYVIRHPSGKGYVSAGNAQSLRLQNFNVGNNTQSRTTTSNVTNTPNNVTLTKQIDPNRLPYKFGSDYNFDPNTGKYFTGAAPLKDGSNIVNMQSFDIGKKRFGGVQKFENGGTKKDKTYVAQSPKLTEDQVFDLMMYTNYTNKRKKEVLDNLKQGHTVIARPIITGYGYPDTLYTYPNSDYSSTGIPYIKTTLGARLRGQGHFNSIDDYAKNPLAKVRQDSLAYEALNYENGGIKQYSNGGPHYDNSGRPIIDSESDNDLTYDSSGRPIAGKSSSSQDTPITTTSNNDTTDTGQINPRKHDIPKNDYSALGKVASELGMGVTQNIGNIYDINRGRNAETEKFDRLSFSKLDPTEALRQNMRSYAAAKKQIKEGSVGSASSYMTNVNQAYINRMNMDNKTRSDYNNANVGITNNERVANQNIDTQEKIANAQNRAMARNLTSSGLGNMGQNIAGQVADSKRTAADEKTLKMYMSYYNDPQFRKAMKDAGYNIG